MKQELFSVCACLDKRSADKIIRICREANTNIGLSERFLDFHPHISLKRTFYTDHYTEVTAYLLEYFQSFTSIDCGKASLEFNKDMLWLKLEKEDEIKKIHEELDHFLLNEYHILIDEFDRNYLPHVTLFRSDDPEKLRMMYEITEASIRDIEVKADNVFFGRKSAGYVFLK